MSEVDEKITSLLSEDRYFEPPAKGSEHAWINDIAKYRSVYRRSMEDLEGYWAARAEELVSWYSPWQKVLDADLHKPEIRWFEGASLNVSYNCLDRHIDEGKGDKVASLAARAVGDARSDVEKVQRLVAFVDQYLEDDLHAEPLAVLEAAGKAYCRTPWPAIQAWWPSARRAWTTTTTILPGQSRRPASKLNSSWPRRRPACPLP